MCSLINQKCDIKNVPIVVTLNNQKEYSLIIEKLKRHYVFEKWLFDWEECIHAYSSEVATDVCADFASNLVNI
jgi:hypothetical protein